MIRFAESDIVSANRQIGFRNCVPNVAEPAWAPYSIAPWILPGQAHLCNGATVNGCNAAMAYILN